MRHFTSLLLVLVCALCASCKPVDPAKAEDDIRETVFRYQFLHGPSAGPIRQVCFLKLNGADPTDVFMRRFTGQAPLVKKGSQCKADVSAVDKETGEAGVILSVDAIKWSGRTSAEVTGGYWVGNLGAAGYTFLVQRENGKWGVLRANQLYIK